MSIEIVLIVAVIAVAALIFAAVAYAKKHPDDPRVISAEARIQSLEERLHLTALHTPAPSTPTPAPTPVLPPVPAPIVTQLAQPTPTPTPPAPPAPVIVQPTPPAAPTPPPPISYPPPTFFPPSPAGTPTQPIPQPVLNGRATSVVLASGVVGSFELPAIPTDQNSGRLIFSIGTMSPPSGIFLECCISRNQGEINSALGRNYTGYPLLLTVEKGWITKPGVDPVGMAAEYADCSGPGPWYANVRLSYPAPGNYGCSLVWYLGLKF